MLDRLATWWLMHRGFYVAGPDFSGVILGRCVATRQDATRIVVTHYLDAKIICVNKSWVATIETKKPPA